VAGKIPQDFIAKIISQSNLLDLAKERGVSFKTMGHRAKALCPFHDEKSPSFTIDANKGFYHCFGCGVHGDAIAFVMAYDHLDFIDAVEYLANRLGLTVPRADNGNTEQTQSYKKWYALMAECADYYHKTLMRDSQFGFARDYVKNRKLTAETCKHFLIGFAPDQWNNFNPQTIEHYNEKDLQALGMRLQNDNGKTYDRFRGRLMFPIRDTLGRIRGFGGRIIADGQPKYLNSPDTELYHKHQLLYGLYEALQAEKQPPYMVVVEGYMDVVSLAQAGVTQACAALGTATSDDHLRLLLRYTNQIVFCFDGDAAGKKAALKALNISLRFMHDGNHIKFLFLPEGDDPDSYAQQHGKDAFIQAINTALNCDEFLFQHLDQHFPKYSLADKAQYAKEAQQFISLVPKGLYHTMLQDRLAETLETTTEQLASLETSKPANNTPAAQPLVTQHSQQTMNTANKCVQLLLNYPELAKDESIQGVIETIRTQGGQKLLCYVAKALHDMPAANTAALLRTIESEKLKQHLTGLLLKNCALNEEQAQKELYDGCAHLTLLQQKEHIHSLLVKAKQQPLSDDEKQILNMLLDTVKSE
jgi:DNA primase